jgi:hypothetical protein
MAHCEACIDIGEQRRNVDVELSRNIRRRRWNVAERRIVLVEKLVIKTLADNFAGSLLDFADVNQHSVALVHRPGKNKICDVIAARAVARARFGAENRQIFGVTPTADVQTP